MSFVREKYSRWIWWLSIAALAIASSFTSITNGFTYDDVHIIRNNKIVHTLDGWWNFFLQSYWRADSGDYTGALYRPLTMLWYTLQWAVGNGAPWLFHVVNVTLYAAVCVLFYWLMRILVPEHKWITWSSAALFAVHPVHVEAVGNVVGQAELNCALMVILAVGLYVKWRREERLTRGRMAVLLGVYVAACLFKEHGILLMPLLAAAELVIVPGVISMSDRFVRLRPFFLSLILVAVGFVWVRSLVIGNLQGDYAHLAWVGVPWSTRFWTMCIAALEWFRLFLWPATLSINYAPGNIAIRHGPDSDMFATLVLFLGIVILAVLLRKKAPIVTFGVLWTAITLALVSNLLFPSGIIIAERTLFLPSAGVMMLVVGSIGVLIRGTDTSFRSKVQIVSGVLLGIILVLGTVHSARRQKIWRDNKAMFIALFNDSPADYRGAWTFSGALYDSGKHEEALRMLETAVIFFDRDPVLLENLGFRYRIEGRCDKAIPLYRKVLQLQPTWTRTRNRLAMCLMHEGKLDEAWQEALAGMENPSQGRNAIYLVRVLLQKKKEAALAVSTSPPQK